MTTPRNDTTHLRRTTRLVVTFAVVVGNLIGGVTPALADAGITFGSPTYDCAKEAVVFDVTNESGITPKVAASSPSVEYRDRTLGTTTWTRPIGAVYSTDGTTWAPALSLPAGSGQLAFPAGTQIGLSLGFADGTYSVLVRLDGVVAYTSSVTVSCPRTSVSDTTGTALSVFEFKAQIHVADLLGFVPGDDVTLTTWHSSAHVCSATAPAPSATFDALVSFSCPDGAPTGLTAFSVTVGSRFPPLAQFYITVSAPPVRPGGMVAVEPTRLVDTRIDGGPLEPGESRTLPVAGRAGVPASGVSAVILNVTTTETTSGGYLTVSPAGVPRPVVSNLNWVRDQTRANAAIVKLGTDGCIDLYQSGPGTAQVVVDISGYYLGGDVTDAGGFVPLPPARVLDTRLAGGRFEAGERRGLRVTGVGGAPASNVAEVVLNVTVTDTTDGGLLALSPGRQADDFLSNLNWSAPNATVANLVVAQVDAEGWLTIRQWGPGTADVTVDVAGYFLAGTPTQVGMFVATTPTRILDTRQDSALAGGETRHTIIAGTRSIPIAIARAVVVNATVTEGVLGGYLTVFRRTDGSVPTTSSLNWAGAGDTVPNLVTVSTKSSVNTDLHNGSPGSVQVVIDAVGYYLGID